MQSLLKGALLSALFVVPTIAQAGYLNGVMYRHATTSPVRHSSYYAAPVYYYQPAVVAQPAAVVSTTPDRTSYSSAFQAPAGQAAATTSTAPTAETVLMPVQTYYTPTYRRVPMVTRTQEIEHGREVIKGWIEK